MLSLLSNVLLGDADDEAPPRAASTSSSASTSTTTVSVSQTAADDTPRKFGPTPEQRMAQSLAAKEARSSKAWLASSFTAQYRAKGRAAARKSARHLAEDASAVAKADAVLATAFDAMPFGLAAGPATRLEEGAKAHVAISACLQGDPVRHNAGHCYMEFIVHESAGMGAHLTFEGVCPEVEGLGMSTPRETIRLVNTSGDLEDWGKTTLMGNKTSTDHTDAMARYAVTRIAALDAAGINGYVLKAASPSCGLRGIPVYPALDTKGRGNGKAQAGMYAKALMELWPELPIEDEGRLQDVMLKASFLTRAAAHQRWRRAMAARAPARAEGAPWAPLLHFHARNALLVEAHTPEQMPQLLAIVAEAMHAVQGSTGYQQHLTELQQQQRQQQQQAGDVVQHAAVSSDDDTCTGTSESDRSSVAPSSDSADDAPSATAAAPPVPADREAEDALYHRYYSLFFRMMKQAPTRATNAACLRRTLAALRGECDLIEAPHAMADTAQPRMCTACVIDADDAAEFEEAIAEYFDGDAPLSVVLRLTARQVRRMRSASDKRAALAKDLGCDMGGDDASRTLNQFDGQTFFAPHSDKRLLATIRQTKFGSVSGADVGATCL